MLDTQANYTTNENGSQQSPIERVLSLLPAKSVSNGHSACCPAHNDKNPSLSIWEDESDGHVGLKCFAGCSRKAICDALGIQETDLYRNDKQFKAKPKRPAITLLELAVDKIIPPAFLLNLNITEMKNGGVRIPHYLMNGENFYVYIRNALKSTDGSIWEKGAKATPYGLDRLASATDSLTIVEGQSDCWTLWLHGISALGLPSANMYNKIESEHVKVFPPQIYIVREPRELGKPDAGKQFVQGVTKRLVELGYQGKILKINLKASHDVKDPNDLHKKLHAEGRLSEFKAEWQKVLDQATSPDEKEDGERDEIYLDEQMREIRDHALESLGKSQKENPTIFAQPGQLVQIRRDKDNKATIMYMGVPEMRNALTQAADFFTVDKKGDCHPASPPKEIAESILALSPSQWPFSPLEAIVEAPVLRPDGTIFQTPGYDDQTRLYYAPRKDMQECNVPDNPSKEDVKKAITLLVDIIDEFPFIEQADGANMLALMMTPVIRPAIKKHVPLALLDAPTQGSGKGLLSNIVSIIATGEKAEIITAPSNEDEWRKQITSTLMGGATIITIDNLSGQLRSAKLDAVLTSDYWKDRMLGFSKMVTIPHRAFWLATGNNIRVGGDLARRCIWVRIDPQTSRAWKRNGFKYEDLEGHVTENRAQIISAILTIARAWFVAGKHTGKSIPKLGTSFDSWAKTIGSILKFTGVDGFLGNLDKLYDEMDQENAQWEAFLRAWHAKFGNKEILVKDLATNLMPEKDDLFSTGGTEKSTGGTLAESLPDFLQEGLQNALNGKKGNFTVSLGKQLDKRVDKCFGSKNLRLVKVRDKVLNITKWKVVTGGTGGSSNTSHVRNFFFSSAEESEGKEENFTYENDADNLRYLRNEDGSMNGHNGTNQGEKQTEPLSNANFDNFFSEVPPVKFSTPPVNYLPCLVCGKPKSIKRADGVFYCGIDHTQ
jgi:hypothetical protein